VKKIVTVIGAMGLMIALSGAAHAQAYGYGYGSYAPADPYAQYDPYYCTCFITSSTLEDTDIIRIPTMLRTRQ